MRTPPGGTILAASDSYAGHLKSVARKLGRDDVRVFVPPRKVYEPGLIIYDEADTLPAPDLDQLEVMTEIRDHLERSVQDTTGIFEHSLPDIEVNQNKEKTK